jgi:hypothetical protein
MKNIRIYLIGVAFFIVAHMPIIAQEQDVIQVQPSVMVHPFTKEGEDALEKYENDFKWQAIVLRINNAFQNRGFRPIDLKESINQVKRKLALDQLDYTDKNTKELLYAEARPDIIIEAIINIEPVGNRGIVGIGLRGIEISSRASLMSMPIVESPQFQKHEYAMAVDRLLADDNRIEAYLDGLDKAFKEIVYKGKSITVDIVTTDDSQCKLGDFAGEDSDFVSELIIMWIQENAHKNQYDIKIESENELSFSEVRIPLRTPEGRNYSESDFARKLSRGVYNICKKKSNFTGKRTRPEVSEGTIRLILP